VSSSTQNNARSNTRTVARNFGWNVVDLVVGFLGALVTTIAVARVIGPEKLGYFNLVFWLTNVASTLGSFGIPLAALKYMAQFNGEGRRELSAAVFRYSLHRQLLVAIGITVPSLVVVWFFANPEFTVTSSLLVLSILPQMVLSIPSHANVAAEDFKANTRATSVSTTANVVLVAASLLLGFGLVGIAAALFISRSAELYLKLAPVHRDFGTLPRIGLDRDLHKRLNSFSAWGGLLTLLQAVVWDRSDILFLKWLQPDIKQISFFSVPFSLADRMIWFPKAFAGAMSATQAAEYGRNKERLFSVTAQGTAYVFMAAAPILLSMACLSGPTISVLYGKQYLPAIPVLAVVALLALPKALLSPAVTLLYAVEDVPYVVKCYFACGILNVILDLLLIPRHAAIGAAYANGIAQACAAAGIWIRVVHRYPVVLPYRKLARFCGCVAAMIAVILAIRQLPVPDAARLVLALATGGSTLLIGLRLARVFSTTDGARLRAVAQSIPRFVQSPASRLVDFIAPAL